MNELEIMNLYTEAKEDKNNKFFENINSNLHVKTAYTDEAVEGRDAFLGKREPDWAPYPWHF